MSWTKARLQSEYNLSEEDVIKTLKVCQLPLDQDEYIDSDIEHKFKAVRRYFNEGRTDTYTGAADLFQQEEGVPQLAFEQTELNTQPKAKKSRNGKKLSHPLSISELLALASEQTGTSISLTDAIKIMGVCGLDNNQEHYTAVECERFSEACVLIKNQGKTYDDVAAHFGVVTANQVATSLDAAPLLEEINELLSQASFIQIEQIRDMLPQLAVEQLAEIKALFYQMTARRLRQHVESGEMEAAIRKASSSLLNGSGNSFGLLNQLPFSSPNPKSLPGSSTNASSNE